MFNPLCWNQSLTATPGHESAFLGFISSGKIFASASCLSWNAYSLVLYWQSPQFGGFLSRLIIGHTAGCCNIPQVHFPPWMIFVSPLMGTFAKPRSGQLPFKMSKSVSLKLIPPSNFLEVSIIYNLQRFCQLRYSG